MFSKSCEYAIKATIYIANQSLEGKRVKVQDIIQKIDTPEAFTAKILQTLAKDNIIISKTGPYGGFEIEPSQIKKIKLSQIVHSIDGDDIHHRCGLGLSQCSADKPCPIHHKFAIVRDELKTMLDTTSLYELAIGLKKDLTFLKR